MFYTQPGMAGLCWDHWHRRACRRWSAPKLVSHCHTRKTGNTEGFFVWTGCEHNLSTTFNTSAPLCHAWRSRRVSSFLQVVFSWNLDRNAVELAAQLSLRVQVFQETRDKHRQTQILQIWLFHFFWSHGNVMEGHGLDSVFGCLRSISVLGLGAVRRPAVKLILQLLGEAFPTRTFSKSQ